MNFFDLRGPEFLLAYGELLLFAVAVALVLRWWCRWPGGPSGIVPDFDSTEAAYLAGGNPAMVRAAVAGLVQRGALSVAAGTRAITPATAVAVGSPGSIE